MPFFDNKGGKMWYELEGSGKKRLLLVGGLGSKIRNWDQQIGFFRDTGHYTVCAFDPRGLGKSEFPMEVESWMTRDMATDVIDLLDHIGWTEGIHIVGLSLGGMILQHMIVQSKERFVTATIISAHGGNMLMLPPGQSMAYMGDVMLSKDTRRQWDMILRLMFSDRYLAEKVDGVQRIDILIERFSGDNIHNDGRVIFQQMKASALHALPKPDMRTLTTIKTVKFLVIAATADRIMRYKTVVDFAKSIHAKSFLVKGAGHCCHREQPELVNKAIHDFITDVCIKNGTHVFLLEELRRQVG